MQFGHAVVVCRKPERENGHAKALALIFRVFPAKAQKLAPSQTQLLRRSAEVFLHKINAESFIARRHGSVCRENVSRPYRLRRLVEVKRSLDHQFSDALESEESRVAFIHMRHGRVDPESAQGPDTADPRAVFPVESSSRCRRRTVPR